MLMQKIIVIEDNPVFCDYICNYLRKNGMETEKTYSVAQARKLIEAAGEDAIVLSDLRLADGNGIELLQWMRKQGKNQPFIMMTDYAEVHTAVETMKSGAEDYVPKKLLEEKILPSIRKLQKRSEQICRKKENIYERKSEAFYQIRQRIRLVAPTDMTVLIFGENGTGKEYIAEKIHLQSKRTDKPFVPVDCGSLSVNLAQSAFFGHAKGAFTGADMKKAGYFQEAEGGTLFLDEVGNLPYETQQMLLRAIQERRYRPIGAKEDLNANIRIIAATNEDLQTAVAEKRFRQDLLYRLQDFTILVPPVRECKEDILPLADFFREQGNRELGKAVCGFDTSARKILLTYMWPGNVREMRQRVQSAVLLKENGLISEEELEIGSKQADVPVCYSLKDEKQEKERIRQALEQANGNRKIAAQLLQVSRTTLYKKLEQYGML
ncbi:sigma-54-dependent Fis family transcriptional regulator [Bacteroides sp. AF16-49]|nr:MULTISPECIES: sigma-54 dependent transcriptional regulator [unclassified Bacteroides]RGN44433.1 sigma-54-dependent Fis family transcriptional regulator [Bacteroides sp. OM05-12]RHR72087.1 sigma-54-dependent Fis family transcriptional regulator [Bacteroides sp. AF16-49]